MRCIERLQGAPVLSVRVRSGASITLGQVADWLVSTVHSKVVEGDEGS